MQRLQTLSISRQIRLSLIGIVLLSLLAVSGMLIFLSYQAQMKTLVNLQKERGQSAAYMSNAYLQDIRQKLIFLTRMQSLTEFSADVQRNLLASLSRQNDAFEALALMDASGKIIAFYSLFNRTFPEDLARQHNFIRPLQRGEEFVGFVSINHEYSQPEVLISMPVRNRQDRVDGVLVALINLKYLWVMVDHADVGSGTIYIVDKYNTLLAQHGADQNTFQLRNLTEESFFRHLSSKSFDPQKPYIGIDGVPVFGVMRQIPEMNWNLAVELPITEAFAPIWKMFYVMGGVLIFTLLASILLGADLARRIVRPLQKLTAVAEEISSGNLGLQVEVAAKNELGVLARTFNQMTAKLRSTRQQIESQQSRLLQTNAEMENILTTVDEGLFLLTREGEQFIIGEQFSLALKRILETDDPSKKALLTILRNRLSEATLEAVVIFLRLMFKKSMDPEMLAGLNPLSKIKLSSENDDPQQGKYLQFNFLRILEGNQIHSLLATVKDVTASTVLALKLQETKEESQDWMALLFQALHSNPHLLLDFMIGFQNELQDISNDLNQMQARGLYRTGLDGIYRHTHSIKGNAGLLQLKSIADRAHEFEDSIELAKESLRADTQAQLQAYSLLVEHCKALDTLYGKLDDILSHLQSFQNVLAEDATDLVAVFLETIERTIQRLSAGLKKKIVFDSNAFPSVSLSFGIRKVLMETLLQLVRNAVAHGIETPGERAQKGKSHIGRIRLYGALHENRLEVRLSDDGRGVQVERLREVAREAGYWQSPQLLDDERVLDLVFAPGISTAQEVDINAGRGMGMDMVRRKLEESGGSIAVASEPDRFCEFIISLPSDAVEVQPA